MENYSGRRQKFILWWRNTPLPQFVRSRILSRKRRSVSVKNQQKTARENTEGLNTRWKPFGKPQKERFAKKKFKTAKPTTPLRNACTVLEPHNYQVPLIIKYHYKTYHLMSWRRHTWLLTGWILTCTGLDCLLRFSQVTPNCNSQVNHLSWTPLSMYYTCWRQNWRRNHPKNKPKLKTTSVKVWQSITREETRHLMMFMDSRLHAVIDYKGFAMLFWECVGCSGPTYKKVLQVLYNVHPIWT